MTDEPLIAGTINANYILGTKIRIGPRVDQRSAESPRSHAGGDRRVVTTTALTATPTRPPEGPTVCAPHATEPVAITLTREEWTEVRDLLDAKPASLGATPGVEHLFEEWAERGLLDTP